MKATLVQQWRLRLAENERSLILGSRRLHWLRRIYVRLYAYLLATYGGATASSLDSDRATEDVAHETCASPMPFVDFTLDDRGQLPRSPESIRLALEDIRSARGSVGAAKSESVVHPQSNWLIVATSQTYSTTRCRQLLNDHGIASRRRAYGRYWAVEVGHRDFADATRCIHINAPSLRSTRRRIREPLLKCVMLLLLSMPLCLVVLALFISDLFLIGVALIPLFAGLLWITATALQDD